MSVAEASETRGDLRQGEQTRARYPDATGYAERAGRRLYWEVYGDGEPTILLLPTWSLVYSRTWRMQIAYLARHFRVVTFDGLGNGRSDRPRDPAAYGHDAFALDALAVMDATGTERAVIVGGSRGGQWGLALATDHAERVQAAVFVAAFFPVTLGSSNWRIGKRLGLAVRAPQSPLARVFARLDERARWFNAPTMRADYPGFVRWYVDYMVVQPHSAKLIEDAVAWGLETDADTLIATLQAPVLLSPRELRAIARRVQCPTLVICGSRDTITPLRDSRVLARLTGARFIPVEGADHGIWGRRPVLVNLAVREFVEGLDG